MHGFYNYLIIFYHKIEINQGRYVDGYSVTLP
jgi:hypothetical protein